MSIKNRINEIQNFLGNKYRIVKNDDPESKCDYIIFTPCCPLVYKNGSYSECGKCHLIYECNTSLEFKALLEKLNIKMEWSFGGRCNLYVKKPKVILIIEKEYCVGCQEEIDFTNKYWCSRGDRYWCVDCDPDDN
jgi:hypothetical protein